MQISYTVELWTILASASLSKEIFFVQSYHSCELNSVVFSTVTVCTMDAVYISVMFMRHGMKIIILFGS